LQAIATSIFDGVVGVVEDAVETFVEVRYVVPSIEIVIHVHLPVAVERVILARVEMEMVQF
jgi:hypothetical protein